MSYLKNKHAALKHPKRDAVVPVISMMIGYIYHEIMIQEPMKQQRPAVLEKDTLTTMPRPTAKVRKNQNIMSNYFRNIYFTPIGIYICNGIGIMFIPG